MDHSLPGASIQEIFQARILEWVAMSSPRGSSWCRDQICILWIDWQVLYPELPGKLCLTMQSAVLMALGIASLVSDNVSLFLIYLLLFAVLILSIKIIRKSKWEMTTLVYSWKADGLCHKIWLVGHLCRHELWEESRRQCNFTGNIWAEIYKILGEGLLLPRWLPKFLIPALWKWNWELIRLVWMMMWELQCVPPPWFVILSWCLHYGLPLLEAYKVMEVSSYSHQFIHSSVRGSRTQRF